MTSVELWAIVAAIAGIAAVLVSVIALEVARRWNSSSTARDDQMAADIARLTGLTHEAREEAREQAQLLVARPRVVALNDGEEADELSRKLSPLRPVDIEAITAQVMELANSTRPEMPTPSPWGISASMFSPTRSQIEDYDGKVERYAVALAAQLRERDGYERKLATLVVLHFRIHNDGTVPLEDARLVVDLAAGLRAERGIEVPPVIDEVPRFVSYAALLGIRPVEIEPFFSDPFIVETGFRILSPASVDWSAGDVQHRNPVDCPPLVLAVESPDTYRLSWQIHADNLTEPVQAELDLIVDGPDGKAAPLSTVEDVGLAADDDDYDDDY